MIGWGFVAAGGGPLLVIMYVSWRGARCNFRRFRHAGRTPPLDGLDVTAATVAPVAAPRPWPEVERVHDPAVAAAYASLAETRAVNWSVAGEGVAIAAGAALGALLTPPFPGRWISSGSIGLALGIGIVGLLARAQSTRLWDPLAAQYRARYAVLTVAPQRPPAPPPRRGVFGVFRRR